MHRVIYCLMVLGVIYYFCIPLLMICLCIYSYQIYIIILFMVYIIEVYAYVLSVYLVGSV